MRNLQKEIGSDQRETLLDIAQHQQIVARFQVKGFACFYGDHDLPLVSDRDSAENKLPARRQTGVPKFGVQQIIERDLIELGKAVAIENIGRAFPALPFGDRLPADADLLGHRFL